MPALHLSNIVATVDLKESRFPYVYDWKRGQSTPDSIL